MTDPGFAKRIWLLPLIAALALVATVSTRAAPSSGDSCQEYLEAKALNDGAVRLLDGQRTAAAIELVGETEVRLQEARKAVITSLRADGDKMTRHVLGSWEKARRESETAGVDTMAWIFLATGKEPQEKASAEFIAVVQAMKAIHAAQHAAITVACRLRERSQP